MKWFRAIWVTSCLVIAPAYSWAGSSEQENEHSQHHPAAAAGQAEKPAADHAGMEHRMADMQEHMKKMQETMQKIHTTGTDAERQKLMDEHMQQMREQMDMMKSMEGMPGMMEKGHPHGMGVKEGGMQCGMMEKGGQHGMGMMEGGMQCGMMDRMAMMQQLMEQMMEHIAVLQSQHKK